MSVFFFSSRRRHTRWPRDWSSDVCSSDLKWTANAPLAFIDQYIGNLRRYRAIANRCRRSGPLTRGHGKAARCSRQIWDCERSEERRVGKEGRSRGWRDQEKKNMENDEDSE